MLSGVDGVAERLPKYCRVRLVLDNDPFEVNDLEETSVKFDVGVDVDDDKFNVDLELNMSQENLVQTKWAHWLYVK